MRFLRFLFPLLAVIFVGAAGKPPVQLRFHTETNPNGGDQFTLKVTLPNSTREVCLSKVAVISEQDVLAVYPFAANDGTQGCAFKLDSHGRIVLDMLSQENHGTMLLGFLNGRIVTALEIDRHVTTGVIYIARGLRPEEIQLLTKCFPVLGADKKKKTEKKHSAQIDPNATPSPAILNDPNVLGD